MSEALLSSECQLERAVVAYNRVHANLPCPCQATLDVGDATRDGTQQLSGQLQCMSTGVQAIAVDVKALQQQVHCSLVTCVSRRSVMLD
jgi:hypothetical protein